ncbi:MAG TPA: class I SAM-dependent methyltransferase [Mycobacteriales bacterium]|nr:class I SAM-dependent methyltransferase [Mycobacteriales bacterium]
MKRNVLECYEQGLRSAAGGHEHGWSLRIRHGHAHELPLHHWTGGLIDGDTSLLDPCTGPTLDVGCGPGRITEALAVRGIPALGIDIAAEAVRQTRRRGVDALHRDVFSTLPGLGRWHHIVLADGNIGIGGDPVRLLGRAHELLARGGTVLCEAGQPGLGLRRLEARLERKGQHSAWFSWAQVGISTLTDLAPSIGLAPRRVWTEAGRWFAELVRL